MNREKNVIWAAGFIDGEGCISISLRREGRHASFSLSVAQRDPRPLMLLKSLFGGNINFHQDNRGDNADTWRWTISSKQARTALEELLPFLVLKRDQADLAIVFHGLMKQKRRNFKLTDEQIAQRFVIKEAMGMLNQRGNSATIAKLPVNLN